jgi:hypothetical protein
LTVRRSLSNHIRSNVIGYIALFISLTIAPAWAATLTENSVKSKHIKDGQVKTQDLAEESIGQSQLGPGSVSTDELNNAGVTSDKIADGAVAFGDIDNTTVQARISPGCPAGQAIQSVSSTGVVTCIAVGSPVAR